MDIKKYIEEKLIEQNELQAVILEISKTGSQLFNDTPNDLDYRIVCENYSKMHTKIDADIDGVHYDFFIFDKEELNARLDFNDITILQPSVKLYNYFQEIREIVYGLYHTGWSMFEYEVEYKQYILNMYNEHNIASPPKPYRSGKYYAHYYIILKIYENQNTTLTNEMINDVKLLYKNTEECHSIINWVIAQMELI